MRRVRKARRVSQVIRSSPARSSASNSNATKTATATCPAGTVVVGGGGTVPNVARAAINTSVPSSTTVWSVTASETDGTVTQNWTLQAYAVCARAG